MKKEIYRIICMAMLGCNVGAQVGIGTNTPDSSAVLDVSSTNKGLLMPRVSLNSSTDVTTVPSPKESLIVYNTNKTSDVDSSLYIYSSKKWNRLIDESYLDNLSKYFNIPKTVASYQNGDTQSLSNDTNNTVTFTSSNFRILNTDFLSFNDTSDEITINQDGLYAISASVGFKESSTTSRYLNVTIEVNKGSDWIELGGTRCHEADDIAITCSVNMISTDFKVGDLFKITVENPSTTSTWTNARVYAPQGLNVSKLLNVQKIE